MTARVPVWALRRLAFAAATAAIVALAAWIVVSLGGLLRIAAVTMREVILQITLLTLPGWFVLTAVPQARRRWPTSESQALLSIPLTILMISAAFVPLQISGAPNQMFTAVAAIAYGYIAHALATRRALRCELSAFLRAEWRFFALIVLVTMCALFYVAVGLPDPLSIPGWEYPAGRTFKMHIDNHLSWLASQTWRDHLAPNALFGDWWRIGDRGPLYSILHSFLYRALEPWTTEYAHYVTLGALLNTLFAGALFLWLRRLSGSPAIAWASAAFVALNPWFFLNIYYTWPKLFGASFVLCAVIVLWKDDPPSLADYAAAGGLLALGMLAHVGTVLSVPFVYLFTLVRYARSGVAVAHSLAMPAAMALLYAPWLLYKAWYSPETYHLFVLHYLGDAGYEIPIGAHIRQFMAEHPWAEQVRGRVWQVTQLWWGTLDWTLIRAFWSGTWIGGPLLTAEFYHPWYSVGALWLPWTLVGLAVNLVARTIERRRSAPRQQTRPGVFVAAQPPVGGARTVVAALALAAVSLSVNAALRWRQPYSHELPYFELATIAACGLYLLRSLGLAYWLVALVAIVTRQAAYFVDSLRMSPLALPPVDGNGILFWITVVVLILPALASRDAAGRHDGRALP